MYVLQAFQYYKNIAGLRVKAMHEPYKSNDISCNNTFSVKLVRSSKVASCLEVNAWTDWQQQDLISEYSQGA